MIPVLLPPVREWYCPNCGTTAQTNEARPHTQYHHCPKLRYVAIPLTSMPSVGTAAKIELRQPEDYIGAQLVQFDGERRPIQSVVTTRDNGNDVAVYPPTATARGD